MPEIPAWAESLTFDPVIGRNEDGNLVYAPVNRKEFNKLISSYPDLSYEEFLDLPKTLINKDFTDYARKMLAQNSLGSNNNTLTFYIDNGGSSPFFDNSSDGRWAAGKLGNNLTLPQDGYKSYIRKVMEEFEQASGDRINLKEVKSDEEALIGIYRTPPEGELLGLSLAVSNGSHLWRNVFYSDSNDRGTPERNRQDTLATIRHEIGHTLGLAHPTDLSTLLAKGQAQIGQNTAYIISDIEPNGTIMSYNPPETGPIPFSFSGSDQAALGIIWNNFNGSSDQTQGLLFDKQIPASINEIMEKSDNDIITGLSINDRLKDRSGDQLYRLGIGNDKLIYTSGFDFVEAGEGADTFVLKPKGENGYLTVTDFQRGQDRFAFKTRSQWTKNITSRQIGGSTVLVNSDTDIVALVAGSYNLSDLL